MCTDFPLVTCQADFNHAQQWGHTSVHHYSFVFIHNWLRTHRWRPACAFELRFCFHLHCGDASLQKKACFFGEHEEAIACGFNSFFFIWWSFRKNSLLLVFKALFTLAWIFFAAKKIFSQISHTCEHTMFFGKTQVKSYSFLCGISKRKSWISSWSRYSEKCPQVWIHHYRQQSTCSFDTSLQKEVSFLVVALKLNKSTRNQTLCHWLWQKKITLVYFCVWPPFWPLSRFLTSACFFNTLTCFRQTRFSGCGRHTLCSVGSILTASFLTFD